MYYRLWDATELHVLGYYNAIGHVYDERQHFLLLLKGAFRRGLGTIYCAYIVYILQYRRLCFSISGWLNAKGKGKKSRG